MTVTFNRLILVERDAGRSGDGHIISRWLCECGTPAMIAYSRVKSGTTKSCGCLIAEAASASATKHGGKGTPEYGSWIAMKRRCEQPTDKDYHRYGARGVSICAEWARDFARFRADMGPRPSGTTLDRIDASGDYTPANARWATAKVQGRNRRGTFVWSIKGRTFECIGDAAEAFGVSEHSVSRWVNGQFDKRRGTFTAPRPDCTVEARY